MKKPWKSPTIPDIAKDATSDPDRFDRFTWNKDDLDFEEEDDDDRLPPGKRKPLVAPEDRAEAHRIVDEMMRKRRERGEPE